LELYVFSVRGVERYRPIQHALEQYDHRDLRKQLSQAALGQESVANAPAVFVITGVVQRTAAIYKERAYRYMLLEVGHASQNLFLQAVALGLNGVAVGAFEDSKVTKLMRLPPDETPLYILPIGRKSTTTQIHK
jgi:SagB-type dehydrogenase family enzyme